MQCTENKQLAVKPSQAVTSIKQLPVLKGHIFLAIENFIRTEPFLRDH